MSEEADKPADAAAPKKSKLGLIIGIVVGVVTLVGGSVAGAVLGPKLLGSEDAAQDDPSGDHEGSDKSQKSEKKSSREGKAPERIVTADIPPVVVDLRDTEGRIRHLKVGLTAELGDKVTAEEFKLVIPRGREAALTFLRALSFEEVSDAQQFIAIRDELAKRVTEAVGEERVHRMMLTDFVLQ